jgi:fucose permease
MIGIVLGPMYPIAIHHTTRVLPRHLVTGTVGWMSAFGQAGSALLPFVTGTMAAQLGIQSLQPLCVFSKPFSFFSNFPRFTLFLLAFL